MKKRTLLSLVLLLVTAILEARAAFVETRITSDAAILSIWDWEDLSPANYISDNKIVWRDGRNGNYDIYMWDPVNGEQQITTNTANQMYPSISGDTVVWQDYRNGSCDPWLSCTNPDIYMWDPINGEQPVCTDPANQYRPDISSDKIVWDDGRNGNYDIYMWDPVNGEQQITTDLAHQLLASISGDMVVWMDYRNGNWDIYMWDPVNGEQPVCTNPAHQWFPSISGNKVVWGDDRNGNYDIYMWDPVNGEQQITTDPAWQWFPSISGDTVVWQDNRNGNYDINYDIYMWDTVSGEQQIITNPANQMYPSISGDNIAWYDTRHRWGSDIYMTQIPELADRVLNVDTGQPFFTIQAAIDDSDTNHGHELIAPPGTYHENINFNGKNITLRNTDPNDLEMIIATIIDGGQNGSVVTFNSGEDANCVLNGFTITNGYVSQNGGGIYCENSSPTIKNCIISNNVSWGRIGVGGGMYSNFSMLLRVHNCLFTGNSAHRRGGGMANEESNLEVINCEFRDNSANRGGGMANDGSNLEVVNCEFRDNSAIYGGGMDNDGSNLEVINCEFRDNSAGQGGGMNNTNSNPTLTNCRFRGNSAGNGGGMYNGNSGLTFLTNCSITDNSAGNGGGMLTLGDNLTLTNCTFSGNSAGEDGGGMLTLGDNLTLTNCTFSGNSAEYYGGGIRNAGRSMLTNCILWENTPEQISRWGRGSSAVTYSDVQGSWPGEGNIDYDPCFVEPGQWVDANDPNIVVEPNDPNAVWVDGDYHLLVGSPCIDAGDNWAVPADTTDLDGDGNTTEPIPWDLDGNSRIVDGNDDGNSVVDMGAYETALSDPVELLDILAQDIIDLGLHQGIENSLLVKLDTALQKLEDDNQNNDVAAINSLQAFINAVEAQRGKKIPEEDADDLIAAALQIINLLSNG